MDEPVTAADCASNFGVTLAVVKEWRMSGCPAERKHRAWWYDLVLVRRWLRERYEEKRAASSGDEVPGDLAKRIREAAEPGDLADISQEVAALTLEEKLTGDRARAVQRLLGEARQGRRLAGSPDETGLALYATEQGAQLLDVFESILSGHRRSLVVEYARREAAADLEELPDDLRERPEDMKRALAELGLDAWAEPIALEEKTDE